MNTLPIKSSSENSLNTVSKGVPDASSATTAVGSLEGRKIEAVPSETQKTKTLSSFPVE